MPIEDAHHWNDRYSNTPNGWTSNPRSLLVDFQQYLPQHGFALDIATGIGTNAGYLIDHGLQVIGVDISTYAFRQAKKNNPQLMAVVGDLTAFNFPANRFDVIINFYYLQRSLIDQFPRLLKSGGIVFFETLTLEMTKIKPEISTKNLLDPGEAQSLFEHFNILFYREGWIESDHGKQKSVASVIARFDAQS